MVIAWSQKSVTGKKDKGRSPVNTKFPVIFEFEAALDPPLILPLKLLKLLKLSVCAFGADGPLGTMFAGFTSLQFVNESQFKNKVIEYLLVLQQHLSCWM